LSQLPLLVIYSVNNSLFDVPNTIVLSRELPQNNVGIDDELLAENLTIVPNPVNDLLNVELTSGTKAVITDQYGKFISEVQSSGTVDVSNYKKGMYFVVITGNNGTVTVKKLMKN
jgi:hypothetical protein